jgi:hypothetical protein
MELLCDEEYANRKGTGDDLKPREKAVLRKMNAEW